MFTKEDIGFVVTPFILTAVMIMVGYTILVQSTPEARINPPVDEDDIEIITNGDIPVIPPTVGLKGEVTGPVITIPQNEPLVDQIIEEAKAKDHKVLYVMLPIKILGPGQFEVVGVNKSSEENMKRWFKVLVNAAHENELRVMFALSLNASQTIDDPAVFAHGYGTFIQEWASIAGEYSTTSFMTGITVGHPVFSELEEGDVSKIAGTVYKYVKEKYSDRTIGVGICCKDSVSVNLTGYDLLQVIPTPEFPFSMTKPAVDQIEENFPIKKVFYFDKDRQQITTVMP